ncbi:MAG: hypothetical protein ACYTG4_09350, partial [Planctomycetota bacterium]
MKTSAPVLFAVAGLAVGLAAGMMLGGDEAPEDVGPVADGSTAASSSQSEIDALRAELETARRDASVAEKELEEARDRAVAASERAAEEAAAEDAAAAAAEEVVKEADDRDPSKHPIAIDGYDESLAKVDWSTVGPNMKAMVPIIQRITGALSKGESPQPEDVGAVQKHNGPLVAAALTVGDGIPGTG